MPHLLPSCPAAGSFSASMTAAATPAPPAADALFGGGGGGGVDDLFGSGGGAAAVVQPNAPPAADALFGGPSADDAAGLFGGASGAAPWQPAPGSEIFSAPTQQMPTPTVASTAPAAADLFGGPATGADALFGGAAANPSSTGPPAAADLFGAAAPAEAELLGVGQPAAAVGGAAAEGVAAAAGEEESPWVMDLTPEGYQCARLHGSRTRGLLHCSALPRIAPQQHRNSTSTAPQQHRNSTALPVSAQPLLPGARWPCRSHRRAPSCRRQSAANPQIGTITRQGSLRGILPSCPRPPRPQRLRPSRLPVRRPLRVSRCLVIPTTSIHSRRTRTR